MQLLYQIATIVLAYTAMAPSYGTGYTCSAPPLQAPCSQTPEPSANLGWGNPVHLATGDKWQQETDLPEHANWPGFKRYYHSRTRTRAPGMGASRWYLSYDEHVTRTPEGAWLKKPDGSSRWLHEAVLISVNQPGQAPSVRWQDTDGTIREFNEQGWLTRLGRPGYRVTEIDRHPPAGKLAHTIKTIRYARQSASLELKYDAATGLLHTVRTPLGEFHYFYDTQERLLSVLRPDGMRRLYQYQATRQSADPYALTGISIQDANALTVLPVYQWRYNTLGQITESASGSQRHPWHFDYQQHYTSIRHGSGSQQWLFTPQRQLKGYQLQPCPDCAISQSESHYDAGGRPSQAQGWTIQRHANGFVERMGTEHSGWGRLDLHFNPDGQLNAWHSPFGQQTSLFDAHGKVLQIHHEAGSGVELEYVGSALQSLRYRHADAESRVQLKWAGARHVQIEHQNETLTLSFHSSHGLLRKRQGVRHAHKLRYTELFHYDEQARLTQHELPEGGQILYTWGKGEQLLAIDWLDASGQLHRIIHSQADRPGYSYGNGLTLYTELNAQAQAYRLTLYHPDYPLWSLERTYSPAGLTLKERHWNADSPASLTKNYTYNDQHQLVVEQDRHGQTWWQWDELGRLHARRPTLATLPAAQSLSPRLGKFDLRYAANRRLYSVQSGGEEIARYEHDAFAQRIEKIAAGQSTAYLYHERKLLAEYDPLADHDSGLQVKRRYIYAHHVPVAMVEYHPLRMGSVYAIHADLVGAPRAMTDVDANLVWLADYTAWGKASIIKENKTLNLRLPGQYFDAETGLHDNLLRTYSPDHGHYLESDPLGPLPGSQAFGYAQQQPLRYIDPWGLILFAFDGTRLNAESRSNVWKLAQLYADGPTHHHSGPGSAHYLEWDAITAWNARQIVENHWQSLLNAIEQHPPKSTPLTIDLLGYSRGAALAREFANRILEHTQAGLFELNHPQRGLLQACVDLRFMGLFDTVAQFGLHGSHNHLYRLGVANAWRWVAHAVALHEHRHLFPLSAINNTLNTVQAPFIGAHGDIGGGVQRDQLTVTDLDKVALAWMHWQAKAAGVKMQELSAQDSDIRNPVLRDARPPFLRYLQNGDRQINYHGHGQDLAYQHEHPTLGQSAREQTEPIIQRYLDWRTRSDEQVGEIDMQAYSDWLEQNLGWTPP